MADSIEGFIPIPLQMPFEQYQACNFPWVAKQRRNNRNEIKPAYQDVITVKAFGGAGFKVSGVWLGDDPRSGRLAGYWFSMNVPTCTLGNNVVLTNGVPRACELAVMYLKLWALEQGCTPVGIDVLDFERVRLSAVTPTFLHDLGSRDAALEVNREVRLAMEFHNKKSAGGKRQHRRAFGVGTTYESTAYLQDRDKDISGYVKDRELDTAQVFESDEMFLRVYDEGERHLRMETLLKGAFLKENQLDRPEDWRLYGGEGPYPKIYALIRKALRLDEELRTDVPTDEEMNEKKVSASDQDVVRWHIAGGNAAEHTVVVGHTRSKLAQQKYLSDLKARILMRLRIDFAIPWVRQQAVSRSRLSSVLQYPGLYVPPVELQDAVFSQHSVPRVALELQSRIAKLMPRRLENVILDPRAMEPMPVTLGKLDVSDKARHTLSKHRVPLHQLLRAHELGIFGTVSLDEALELSAAIARGETVTSRFPIFDKVILITTDPILGTTKVVREDEKPQTPL